MWNIITGSVQIIQLQIILPEAVNSRLIKFLENLTPIYTEIIHLCIKTKIIHHFYILCNQLNSYE